LYGFSVAEAISLPVELGACITKAILASAELTEILRSLGDRIIIELEYDATGLHAVNFDVELCKDGKHGGHRLDQRQTAWRWGSIKVKWTNVAVGHGYERVVKRGGWEMGDDRTMDY
jgi:hypothetical protein